MTPALSFIIPAYNESSRLGNTLREVLAYFAQQPYETEIIVVDDGSVDDTAAVAEQHFAEPGRVSTRVLRYEPNRGKGYAVRKGLLAAQGPIAVFSDADLSTPIAELPALLGPIQANECDVVFGSRALNRELIGVHQPWLREQSGRVFNVIMNLATGLPYSDTQCGFKAFRMDVCRPVVEGSVVDRFGFDVELLYVAHRAGLRLREVAVHWNDAAGSKVSMLNGISGFWELRELRRQARKGLYDEAIRKTQLAVNAQNTAATQP